MFELRFYGGGGGWWLILSLQNKSYDNITTNKCELDYILIGTYPITPKIHEISNPFLIDVHMEGMDEWTHTIK